METKKVTRGEIIKAARESMAECNIENNIFAEALVTLLIKDMIDKLFRED